MNSNAQLHVETHPTIIGIDLSSFQLNAAILRPNQPPELRVETIGRARKDELVDRLGRIPDAIDRLTRDPNYVYGRAEWLVVEEPFGTRFQGRQQVPKALLMTAGACLAACGPLGIRPYLITPLDWRRAIGAKNTKPDGHIAVEKYLMRETKWAPFDLDEHELDALGIALGALKTIQAQETT